MGKAVPPQPVAAKRVRQSAGILLYRYVPGGGIEVLLAHPGGPFFARKDLGVWTIPKGEYDDELAEVAAAREFEEEIGLPLPDGEWIDLGEVRQASGKRVRAFAVGGDVDATACNSNLFEMEWPPRSGLVESFPEVDRAGWFPPEEAARRLNPSQAPLVERLLEHLAYSG
jgi:predicted NUDIX family NTP pyrophosphohydrolase